MPDACPSIRSTARWVLPVLVGPRTAMSREASPRAGERFILVNVEDVGARRKAWRRSGLVTSGAVVHCWRGAQAAIFAIGGNSHVLWPGRGDGLRGRRQALRSAVRQLHPGRPPVDRGGVVGRPSLVRR